MLLNNVKLSDVKVTINKGEILTDLFMKPIDTHQSFNRDLVTPIISKI